MNKFTAEYFASKLVKELSKSKSFQKLTSDRLDHSLYIGRKALTTQVKNALGIENNETSAQVNTAINKFFTGLKANFPASKKHIPNRYFVEYLSNTRSSFHIKVTGPNATSNVKAWIDSKLNNLKKVLYEDTKDLALKEVSSTAFLSSSTSRRFSSGLKNEIFSFFEDGKQVSKSSIDKFALELSSKDVGLNSIIDVTLSGPSSVIGEALLQEPKLRRDIINSVKTQQNMFEGLVKNKTEKQLFSKVKKDLGSAKGVSIRGFNYIAETKSKSSTKFTSKTKSSSDSYNRSTNSKYDSSINFQALIKYINARLPSKVAEDMGSPRLNYKSGRFSNSAEVTNAFLDGRNKINIDYSYMKYPYQTFEPGFAQGSIARDPRALISGSIRDIATEVITKKFKLRRV